MSFERMFNRAIFQSIFCVTSLLVLAVGPAAAQTERDSAICDRAAVLDLGATSRLSAPLAGEDLFLRVDVPGPGFLSLAAVARGDSNGDPVLVLTDTSCDGLQPIQPIVLERTMASLTLGVKSPGEVVFRVTSADPTEKLSDLKVYAGHVSFGEDEDEIEGDIDPFAGPGRPSTFGEDEDEIEGDIDPFAGPGKPSTFGEDEDEIEGDIDPFAGPGKPSTFGEDEDEIEGDIDPFAGGGKGKLATFRGTGDLDDHGDTLAYASLLAAGRSVTGELGNDWGDDVDVFRFTLPGSSVADLWRIELVTTGETETRSALFDARGLRLHDSGASGREESFRIVRMLPPGVYYVRVAGSSGARGVYGLELSVSEP